VFTDRVFYFLMSISLRSCSEASARRPGIFSRTSSYPAKAGARKLSRAIPLFFGFTAAVVGTGTGAGAFAAATFACEAAFLADFITLFFL